MILKLYMYMPYGHALLMQVLLFGHQNNLDILRMKNGTMFVFMTWSKIASKCWFASKCIFHDAALTQVEQ